ncbi:MAG: hypothetical protein ACOX4M_04930 [Acetivibrionales bacterium]
MLDDYISKNYSGKITATICVRRPVANSRYVGAVVQTPNGGYIIDVGHTFLRLDDGMGNVEYIGFYNQTRGLKMTIGAYDVGGVLLDDSESKWNVAKVFVLDRDQLDGIYRYIDYIKEKKIGYDQCQEKTKG